MEFENGWGLGPPKEPVDSSTEDVAPVMPDEVIEDVTTGAWPVSRVRRRSA